MVNFRISDEGGGIESSLLDRVWQYGFSTTSKKNDKPEPTSFSAFWMHSQEKVRSDLSGYGFGLPFSRLHARYFGNTHKENHSLSLCVGGDLQLVSIPSFGVDVFLTTKKLDRNVWSESEKTERVEYTEAAVGNRRTAY